MIKGIVALFTSGAIFNPMILLGIFFGILFDVKMSYEQMIEHIYKNYHFYLLALLLAAAYNFVFHKINSTYGHFCPYASYLLFTLPF